MYGSNNKGALVTQILRLKDTGLWSRSRGIMAKKSFSQGMVLYIFNGRIKKESRSLSLRPTWSTKKVPGQPGIQRETLSQKKKLMLAWCSSKTSISGSRCITPSFAWPWISFPPIGLPCSASVWRPSPSLSVSHFVLCVIFGRTALFWRGNEGKRQGGS